MSGLDVKAGELMVVVQVVVGQVLQRDDVGESAC